MERSTTDGNNSPLSSVTGWRGSGGDTAQPSSRAARLHADVAPVSPERYKNVFHHTEINKTKQRIRHTARAGELLFIGLTLKYKGVQGFLGKVLNQA